MKKYILAEHLKYKHSFLKKLLILAPFITVASAFLLMPTYFTVNAYNWWYVMLMPAAFALIPSMIHRTEDRKLNYRAVYPLNVNLKEVWFSKVITILTPKSWTFYNLELAVGQLFFFAYTSSFFLATPFTQKFKLVKRKSEAALDKFKVSV